MKSQFAQHQVNLLTSLFTEMAFPSICSSYQVLAVQWHRVYEKALNQSQEFRKSNQMAQVSPVQELAP